MRAILIVAMLTVAGCATTGAQISESQMATIEKGKTTYSDVVARLGVPTTSTVAADGTRIATYNFAKSKMKGETFIPFVGLWAGGMKVDGTVTTFTFDAGGVLKDYSVTETHINTKNGG